MKNFRSIVPVLGLIVFALLFVGSLVGAVYSFRQIPPQQQSQPHAMLVAEPSVIDLGQVGPAFHEVTIKLANPSKYPIAILDIKMTCSCTQVSFSRKTIEAGKSTELHCILDTNGKKGKTGAKLAVIYVPQTDDSDVDTAPHLLAIDLHADVKPLEQLPAVVSLN
jgi:hypothetical protein